MFRYAVQLEMVMRVLTELSEYTPEQVEEMRHEAINNVRRTRGKVTGRNLQKLYQDLRENGRLREVQKEKSPGLSASTVRGIRLMLHNALDRAVKERLIQRNPTADCIAPKLEKKEMKFLPSEDMKALSAMRLSTARANNSFRDEKSGWNFLPGSIQPFPFISACGSRCGSGQKADRATAELAKKIS